MAARRFPAWTGTGARDRRAKAEPLRLVFALLEERIGRPFSVLPSAGKRSAVVTSFETHSDTSRAKAEALPGVAWTEP